jgi:DNA-binding GntR family transcriptional regulator
MTVSHVPDAPIRPVVHQLRGRDPAEPTVAGHGRTPRRPTAVTRHIARTIMAAEPQLSRTELANRLGVSTRRLREVLAA